jgi:hypothetical protein
MIHIALALLVQLFCCCCVTTNASDAAILAADGTRVPLAGWVEPLPPADEAVRGHICNIDKRPHLTRVEFLEHYR